ncbi:MAG: acyltransferase family protein [Solirubrobacterales bacterium]
MTDAPEGQVREADGGKISQAGERRDAYIESLRALGCVAVVMAHVGVTTLALPPGVNQLDTAGDLFTRGVYGVGNIALFVFFAISGFAIYMPFAKRDFAGGGAVSLRRYATNRALRILPLYYAVTAAVLLFIVGGATPEIWARFLTFSQNFEDQTTYQFVNASWSLVVELHFYLVLPLLAWVVARIARRSLGRAAAVLIGLALACMALRLATVGFADAPRPVWRASTLTNFQFILAGMVAALFYLHLREHHPRWMRGPVLKSDLWLLATVPLIVPFTFIDYTWDVLCPLIAFLILGAAAFPRLDRGPVTRVLWWRPLAALGLASYSVYLWHIYVLDYFTGKGVDGFAALTLFVLPVSIAAAAVSYKLIEEPFLRLRRRWSPAAPRQEA